jgi:type II secretion system protein J
MNPKHRAFSLIEILIAASLLALIGGLILQSLSSTIDAKDVIETTSNRHQQVRQAMTRMVDEIAMAYLSNHVARNSPEQRTETGFKGERDRIDFTAFGYVARVEDQKRSDQRQLSFFLGDDERTQTKSLRRREQPNLDDDYEKGGRELTLLANVQEFELSYFDAQKDNWTEKWDAAGTETNRLPQRVKMKIVVVMEDNETKTFVSQSRIWMQTPVNF